MDTDLAVPVVGDAGSLPVAKTWCNHRVRVSTVISSPIQAGDRPARSLGTGSA